MVAEGEASICANLLAFVGALRFSKLVALARSRHVWAQDPFDVRFGLLDRALSDLVRPHFETRSYFGELDFAV